jgi:ubiquinone/menaquinone biosynthesis C-methylase UbiE
MVNSNEMYETRKSFFNDHALEWLDMWYKDKKSGRYDLFAKQFDRLFSIVRLEPGDAVFDAGCGTGVLVPHILSGITETGLLYEVDYAEKMIEVNKKLHPQENIRFIVTDVAEAPVEKNSCDVVLCFSCFPHFHDKPKTLETLSGILRPKGILAIAHFDSSEQINHHHSNCRAVMHDTLPDSSIMQALIRAAGFEITLFVDEPGFYCIVSIKA